MAQRMMMLCLMIGLMPLLLGCAAKRIEHVELVVEPHCIEGPIRMIDCDGKNPPNCRKSLITFKEGCEYVVTRK